MSRPPPDDDAPPTASSAAETVAPRTGAAPLAPDAALAGDRYVIDAEVARGGIGRVLRAHDRKLGRTVAIKELLGASRGAAARFAREATLTARLQHPGIVPVYDAGERAGEPFYAMKLVGGRTLADQIREAATLRDRLALLPRVLAVAEALAYAHSEGVIHRDLKPSNVLVGEFGETLVIDWGLAKQLRASDDAPAEPASAPASDADGLTVAGAVMGTPSYMSPEQASGAAVDARADVYALGAMLYHLLAGVAPHRASTAQAVLASVLAGPPLPLAECVPLAPRELVSITERAMARAPADRYPDAGVLADDLRRFLTGQLVEAYRYSRVALLGRWVRRNRAAVAVAAVLLAALAATATVSVWRVLDERDRATRQRDVATRRGERLRLLQAQAALGADPTAAIAWLRDLGDAVSGYDLDARLVATAASARGVARHVLRGHTRGVRRVAYTPDGARLASASHDGAVIVWRLAPQPALERRLTHPGAVRELAVDADGASLVTVGDDGVVRRWELATGTSRELHRHAPLGVYLAVARDGTVVTGGDDGLALATTRAGVARALPGHPGGVLAVAASPDGARVATAGADRVVRLVALDGDAPARELPHPDVVLELAFSPDGTALATAGNDGVVRLWPIAGGEPRALDPSGETLLEPQFSPDGRALAAVDHRGQVSVWDVATGRARAFPATGAWVYALRFSPAGDVLVAASKDGAARLLRLADGDVRELRGHRGPVSAAAVAPDGITLATAGDDGLVRIWPAISTPGARAVVHAGELRRIAVARDAPVFASGARDGTVAWWDARTGERRSGVSDSEIGGLALADDGRTLAFVDHEGIVAAHDAGAEAARTLGTHDGGAAWLALDGGGATAATAGADGRILLWPTAGGTPRALVGHHGAVMHVAFAADGAHLASGGVDGAVRWWDVAAGTSRELGRHRGPVMRAVPVPGDAHVISVGQDGVVRLWDVAADASRVLGTHDDFCGDVAVSADGARAVTASWDGTLGLWDLRAGAGRRIPGHGPGIQINSVAITADGSAVVSAGEDGAVRVWTWAGEPVRALVGHTGAVMRLALAASGAQLASGGADGALRVWDAPLAPDPAAADLAAWIAALTTAVVGDGGAIATPLSPE